MMLYGNIIFIKKSGGDGSKYPVTERDIMIGRSEKCLIRIYNRHVAPEHCQLIVEENGQATLRNLSNKTILNGKLLNVQDVALCHGDNFKLGERLARWEYPPTSKYYKQLLSPTGHLTTVVLEQQSTISTPTSEVSVVRNTPLEKRRDSERSDSVSEGSSGVKIRKSSGTHIVWKMNGDLPKLVIGRPSLTKIKLLLHGKKLEGRRSISGVSSSNTPKGKVAAKSRKSTLPSWKVKFVSPQQRLKGGRSSTVKSITKSGKSPKNEVSSEDIKEPKFSQKLSLSVSKSGLKTPKKVKSESESSDAASKSASTPSSLIAESPRRRNEGSVRSTRSFSKSPSPRKSSPKSPFKKVISTPKQKTPKKLVQSESKIDSRSRKQSALPKGTKRMSLILEKTNSGSKQSLIKKLDESSSKKAKVSDETVLDSVSDTSVPEKETHKADKTTLGKLEKTPRKSLLRKVLDPTGVKTPRRSVLMKTPKSLKSSSKSTSRKVVSDVTRSLIDFDYTPNSKKGKCSPRNSPKSTLANNTPRKDVKNVEKNKSASRTMSPTSSLASTNSDQTSISRKSSVKKTPLKATGRISKTSVSSPRGVRRKLSPSSSAERAAKKLKTSSPKKPDKNKKAALLVLGKANRKHLLSQNVKVLLKQKIVKKAIKQSTTGTTKKVEGGKLMAGKVTKGVRKNVKAYKKSKKERKLTEKKLPGNSSRASAAGSKLVVNDITEKGNPEEAIPSQVQPSPRHSSKGVPEENSPSRLSKKDPPNSVPPNKSPDNNSVSSPSSFERAIENYLFNSNRRSKRLSSKNDTGRPDFIELSPTALGLMPKPTDVFKTPKESKRRSSSLVTPKNVRNVGIIKSASTSKIGNRKSVRFSSKDHPVNSEFYTPNTAERIDMDFSSVITPDVTVDVFVSPLTEKSDTTKRDLNDSKTLLSKMCGRKLLQSPEVRKSLVKLFPTQNANAVESQESKDPKNDLDDIKGVRQLFATPKSQKNPKNSLSDLRGVPRLLRTPKNAKSPKNDLTDVRGVKKLLRTPKVQKSPKNDLTDVRGVKKLLKTPTIQKSPKNDLTDVRGVKKLLRTPKVQKSPKNDLTDVRGVKKLLRTPKIQKSPRNDLTDVRGLKNLLKTPTIQKSPKNDLTDVRGVKKLLKTPKVQKSPKNDLTDVRGVKKLLKTPKVQKSPKNDLTDVRGVKKLLKTPKVQKSPKNDLTDVAGVKELLGSPKVQRSPKNDLSDLRGVKKLLGSPREQKSPKNDLSDVAGVKKLLTTPRVQKSPKNNLLEVSGIDNLFQSPRVEKSPRANTRTSPKIGISEEMTGLKQLLITKSPKTVSRKVKDYRAIRGRRTIYTTPKVPKNDLTDVAGVRELFSRHKPISDYNVSLTGVAELFDVPEVVGEEEKRKPTRKSVAAIAARTPTRKSLRPRKEEGESEDEKIATRRGRQRRAVVEEVEKKPARIKKLEADDEKRKPAKRKATEKVTKSTGAAKKPAKPAKKERETETSEAVEKEVKSTRKRKASPEDAPPTPPKLRKKVPTVELDEVPGPAAGISRRVAFKLGKSDVEEEVTTVRSTRKTQGKAKDTKTGTKRTQKVQTRSQRPSKTDSDGKVKASPIKTRSAKAKEEKKVSKGKSRSEAKSTVGERATSPAVKKSGRRK